MARDKQLVVRLTEKDRSAFQKFCMQNKVQASTLLDEIIQRLISGDLALDMGQGKQKASPFKVEVIVREQVQEAIAKLKKNIDDTVTEIVKEQVKNPIKHNVKPQKIDPPKDPAPTAITKIKKKHNAPEHGLVYDPEVGFTSGELRKYLGYQSRSFPSNIIIKRPHKFEKLTQDKDPDKLPWYWKDTGQRRMFFRKDETNV